MKNIAVIGKPDFVTGFMQVGIQDIIEVSDKPLDDIREVRDNPDIGIVIIDENILCGLDAHDREEIENNITPVFISLSTSLDQEGLRKLIKKSIGIDVWK